MQGSAPLRVAVVGAGMSGILAGKRLRQAGLEDFVIYEKAPTLGGTWWYNTYPGVCCDVASHLYRYADEPNPDWTQRCASGAEIRAYLQAVADRRGVTPHIRFATEVTGLDWDGARWSARLADGACERFDVVLAACGFLHRPAWPDIPGREAFGGPAWHTAEWRHDLPLAGRRVGLIGAGSTAVQVASAIAPDVAHLTIFQRTPQWIMPLENTPVSAAHRAELRARPELMDEEYRRELRQTLDTFGRAVIGDVALREQIADYCRQYLATVADPALRARLTPDYALGCKRLVMSATYYRTVQQPQVALVTEGIERIERQGVRTRDGRLHELDVLVYATGFQAHAYTAPMVIRGEDDAVLAEGWADEREVYRSMMIPGFPNLFLIGGGPQSPIGNNSIVLIAEAQMGYVMQLVERLRRGECRRVSARPEAARRFLQEVHAAMPGTVWASGCRSWYLDRLGRPVAWPWSFERFAAEMAAPRMTDLDCGTAAS